MPGCSEQEQVAVGGQEGKSVREGLGCVPGGVGSLRAPPWGVTAGPAAVARGVRGNKRSREGAEADLWELGCDSRIDD